MNWEAYLGCRGQGGAGALEPADVVCVSEWFGVWGLGFGGWGLGFGVEDQELGSALGSSLRCGGWRAVWSVSSRP